MSIRDKFKATPVSKIKKVAEEEDKSLRKGGGFSDKLKLEDGKNMVRFFPKHEEDDNFYMLVKHTWLPFLPDDADEPTKKPVMDAIVHGGYSRDIVAEYIAFVTRQIESGEIKGSEAKRISDILVHKDKGIAPRTSWEAYAFLISKTTAGTTKEFGILAFSKTIRDGLNEACISEDDDDDIVTDPFTDPDEGKLAIITKDSVKGKKDPKKYYSVTIGRNPNVLSDEELEMYSTKPSLTKLYKDVYTVDEFEKACEGLQTFDEINEIGLYDDDEFQKIIAQLHAEIESGKKKAKKKKQVEEDEDEDDEPVKKKSTSKAKPSKKVVDEDEDDEDLDEEEEDEEPAPKKKSKVVPSKPSKPAKKVVDEDEEDEDEEEEEPAPKKKTVAKPSTKKKPVVDEDEEDDDEDDEEEEDDDDDEPKGRSTTDRIAQLKKNLNKKK